MPRPSNEQVKTAILQVIHMTPEGSLRPMSSNEMSRILRQDYGLCDRDSKKVPTQIRRSGPLHHDWKRAFKTQRFSQKNGRPPLSDESSSYEGGGRRWGRGLPEQASPQARARQNRWSRRCKLPETRPAHWRSRRPGGRNHRTNRTAWGYTARCVHGGLEAAASAFPHGPSQAVYASPLRAGDAHELHAAAGFHRATAPRDATTWHRTGHDARRWHDDVASHQSGSGATPARGAARGDA